MLNQRTLLRPSLLCTLALLLIGPFVGCGSDQDSLPAASLEAAAGADATATSQSSAGTISEPTEIRASDPGDDLPQRFIEENQSPEVILTTNKGVIRVRLDREKAPLTVDNFLSNYVERQFYDQTIVHYVEQGFMIAAGGYTPDYQPKDPRAAVICEANNGLKNLRGTLAMARDPDFSDSATSQFYINLVDNSSLDHQSEDGPETYGYCVFGEVVEGMDVVDAIAQVSVEDKEQFVKTPSEPVIIESVRLVPAEG